MVDISEKKWHEIHAKNIRKRESTRPDRLLKRKMSILLNQERAAMRFNMVVPEEMDILSNYKETVDFINLIKQNIFNNQVYILLDFSKCKSISAETCVVLAAEIDRCRKFNRDCVSGTYPAFAEVYLMLNELGFFTLLNVRSSRPIFDDFPEVDIVKLSSGHDNPEHLMKGMKKLFYSEDGLKPRTPYSQNIFRALTEAMGNAVEHAYPDNFKEMNKKTCLPRWWRAGFKDNDTDNVLMVIYDQGAGIPNTINTTWQEKVSEFMSRFAREPYDDEKLALAMEKGRSRTKLKGRGKGSYDMQQLIRESTNGVLNIVSYQGKYRYNNDGSWASESLPVALQGTLIIWRICLKTIENEIYEKKDD